MNNLEVEEVDNKKNKFFEKIYSFFLTIML